MPQNSNNIKTSYSQWSETYDQAENKTRDLEGKAIRQMLRDITFETCLEVGCGTGKNTEWLVQNAKSVMAIDLTMEMIEKAQQKISSKKVVFKERDICQPWDLGKKKFDLISFSLVLEHIDNLDFVFIQLSQYLSPAGYVYIGEYHPFRQYLGKQARYETHEGMQMVDAYQHHLSDFAHLAHKFNFQIRLIEEFFDENEERSIPRILCLLLQARA